MTLRIPERALLFGLLITLLLTLLPYAFVASYPVYVLFNGPSWQALAHTAAVVGGAFTLMVLFWRQGLRAYSSASS